MMNIQLQKWSDFTRVLIADRKGSVQVDLYDRAQEWGGTAWLYALWVEPYHRRKGKAEELITLAEDLAAQLGHETVTLEWHEKDTPVEILNWYLRRGYVEVSFSGNGDYCLLRRNLPRTGKKVYFGDCGT